MRVALELTPLHRPGSQRGLGRYAAAVLAASSAAGHDIVPLIMRPRSGRWAQFGDVLERQARLTGLPCDVFHATNPHMSAVWARAKMVTSILDVVPFDHPGYQQTGVKTQLFFRLAARADTVITLSTYSARRISTRLGVADSRIVVARLAPAAAFTASPDRSYPPPPNAKCLKHGRLVAAVVDLSVVDPRKRADWLPEIGRLLARHDCQLVLAGARTDAFARSHPPLVGLGHLSDEQLASLFRRSLALVYTSAYEGQGLPPLEAMACGTPVVAMCNTAIPEVVGPGGLLLDEDPSASLDEQRVKGARALADACVEIASNPAFAISLRRAAHTQSQRFTVSAFQRAIAAAYTV